MRHPDFPCRRSRLDRMLRFLRLRRPRAVPEVDWPPPGDDGAAGVREPRRPRPSAGGAAAAGDAR